MKGRADRPARGPAPLVALVAGGGSPVAAGAALACGLRGARGDAAAVVAVLPGSACGTAPPATVPARAAARRLVASFRLRGSDAVASGRLVLVRLGEDPRAGAAESGRLAAACDVPVVVVVGGSREVDHDGLLSRCDAVVGLVPADAPDGLEALARASGIAHVVSLDPSPTARGLALTGLPVLGPLRDLGATLGRAS